MRQSSRWPIGDPNDRTHVRGRALSRQRRGIGLRRALSPSRAARRVRQAVLADKRPRGLRVREVDQKDGLGTAPGARHAPASRHGEPRRVCRGWGRGRPHGSRVVSLAVAAGPAEPFNAAFRAQRRGRGQQDRNGAAAKARLPISRGRFCRWSVQRSSLGSIESAPRSAGCSPNLGLRGVREDRSEVQIQGGAAEPSVRWQK